MGFIREIYNDNTGIQYFYIIGLLIFIILLAVVVYRTLKIPRRDLIKYKTSILDNDDLKSKKI
jgi:hypothetical protein